MPELYTKSQTEKNLRSDRSLGTVTESASAPEKDDRSARVRLRIARLDHDRQLLLKQPILDKDGKQRFNKDGWPLRHRIAYCLRRRIDSKQPVGIDYDPATGHAHYTNLGHCGKPSCAYCGPVKTEQARREILVAASGWLADGKFLAMASLTGRHNQLMALKWYRERIAAAYRRFCSGRWYQDFCAEYGIEHTSRSWEAPYGANGWHVHAHVLWFMLIELTGPALVEFEAKVRKRWLECLKAEDKKAKKKREDDGGKWFDRENIEGTWERAAVVRTGESAIAEYIAKYGHEPQNGAWGVEHEMTKGSTKKAHKEGLTPLELLDASRGESRPLERLALFLGVDHETAQKRAGELRVEYIFAFDGRAQLYWSKGAKAALNVAEGLKTLEAAEAAQNGEAGEICPVAVIYPDGWGIVLRSGLRADLLLLVETGDTIRLAAFFDHHGINADVLDTFAAMPTGPPDPAPDPDLFSLPVDWVRVETLAAASSQPQRLDNQAQL